MLINSIRHTKSESNLFLSKKSPFESVFSAVNAQRLLCSQKTVFLSDAISYEASLFQTFLDATLLMVEKLRDWQNT